MSNLLSLPTPDKLTPPVVASSISLPPGPSNIEPSAIALDFSTNVLFLFILLTKAVAASGSFSFIAAIPALIWFPTV